jgi:cell division protein FtsB
MDMSNEDKRNKEHSKISLRIGEVQVELEGTYDNIKKLMDKDLVNFTKGLEKTTKQLPSSTEIIPEVTPKAPETAPKAPEVTPKAKTVPPPSKPSAAPETPSQPPRAPTVGKKTEKISKKKIGWKPLTLALVMICIALSAGLVGVIAVYLPMVDNLNSQVAEKNTNIAALNSQVSSLNSQISSLQDSLEQNESYIANLEEGIEILNSQIAGYLSIIYLNETDYLPIDNVSQNASTHTVLFNGTLKYNGYVAVSAESTSNTTYIQLLYSSYGVNYDHNITVGTSGTAYFPVLIGEIEIRLGNTDTYAGDFINATATARYIY